MDERNYFLPKYLQLSFPINPTLAHTLKSIHLPITVSSCIDISFKLRFLCLRFLQSSCICQRKRKIMRHFHRVATCSRLPLPIVTDKDPEQDDQRHTDRYRYRDCYLAAGT